MCYADSHWKETVGQNIKNMDGLKHYLMGKHESFKETHWTFLRKCIETYISHYNSMYDLPAKHFTNDYSEWFELSLVQ